MNENDNSIVATGKTVHGFIDENGKPKKPPKSLLQKIESLLV